MATTKARYCVETWDTDRQDFTPQQGVRKGPYSLFGLRKALRALQRLGYDTSRAGGHWILVYRVNHRAVRDGPGRPGAGVECLGSGAANGRVAKR